METQQKIELLKIASSFNIFSMKELIENYNRLVELIQ